MSKTLLCATQLLHPFFYANAHVNISASGNVIKNFNSLGMAATLTIGWKMSAQGSGKTSGWSTASNITRLTPAAFTSYNGEQKHWQIKQLLL